MRHPAGKALTLSCATFLSATLVAAAQPVLQPVGLIGSPAGTGKWPAVAEAREDLRTHTIYRPAQMPDTPLPVLIWGNGGCSDNGLSHSAFLREVASHGYFVIALGYPRTEPAARAPGTQPAARPPGPPAGAGPGARPPGPPAGAGAPPPGAAPRGQIGGGGALPTDPNETDPTVIAQMDIALHWATAVNELSSSSLQGHLDMTRVAVAGHSCGGLQSIKYAANPRIKTSMIFDSGVYNVPGGLSRVKVNKFDLHAIHGPIAYVTGGPTDQAHPNALDDGSRIKHVPVFVGWLPVGHGGTFSQPNGGDWASIAVNWLNWQLKGDASAQKWFVGKDCGYCADARWNVEFNPAR